MGISEVSLYLQLPVDGNFLMIDIYIPPGSHVSLHCSKCGNVSCTFLAMFAMGV